MGFNTSVLILNDALNDIRNDKAFGEKLCSAISRSIRDEQVNVSSGSHGTAATVITCDHADTTALIAIGGNCASILMKSGNRGVHHTTDAQVKLLKQMADQYGFRLVTKPKKKTK